MTNKILGLLTTLLLLSACTLALPSTTDTGAVETGVFQTLTAWPSPIPPTKTPIVIIPTQPPPLPTSTLAPTNTPVPSPSATPIPTLAAYVPLPSAVPYYSPLYPDQFIRYYYTNINLRNYQLTWSLLADSFKWAVNGPDQGGFLGYADFWDTVQRVDIFGVSVTSQSGGYAAVDVSMQYSYKNGFVSSTLQSFNLIFDYSRSTWLFNSFTSYPTPPPPPPVNLQTPTQFIYNYFANINAGNYGLTWSLLTDRFKTNVNHNSYDDYANFWTSISRLDITGVSIESQTATNAVVTVGMVYNYLGGLVTTSNQQFNLYYDAGRGTWLFHSPY